MVLVFNKPINLLNKDDFILTLTIEGVSEVLIPESIELDSSAQQITFQLNFGKTVDNGSIEISTKPGSLTVQNKSNETQYYTEFPETSKFPPLFIPNFLVNEINYFDSAATKSIENVGSVGAKVTTAVTAGLMIVSFPIALTLIKLF